MESYILMDSFHQFQQAITFDMHIMNCLMEVNVKILSLSLSLFLSLFYIAHSFAFSVYTVKLLK